jgi:hypothetical protein
MDSDTKIKIKDLADQKWMRVEFTFEVLGVTKQVVEKALKEHVEKISSIKGPTYVFRTEFSNIEEVENPTPRVKKALSQIVEVEAMIKDLKTLIAISISYGPSSIEVLEPKKLEVNVGEIQDVANMVSGIIHQIAAAGLGGIVATPKSSKGAAATGE